MFASTPTRLAAASPALEIALDRLQDFLLARVFGDVEGDEAAIGEPDISDDPAVGPVVEVKERTRLILERGGSRFLQLTELAKLV